MTSYSGYTRVLEAILALMFLSIPFLLSQPINPHGMGRLRETVMDALVKADIKGNLTIHVYDEKWSEVEKLLTSLLPSSIKFSITITDDLNNTLHIANKGLMSETNAVVVSYILMFRGMIRIVTIKAAW